MEAWGKTNDKSSIQNILNFVEILPPDTFIGPKKRMCTGKRGCMIMLLKDKLGCVTPRHFTKVKS